MSLVIRTTLLAVWLLGTGLLAVSLEAENIRVGHRIHDLLGQREKAIERVRRLEVRYNQMVSPDLLERSLPESFRPEGRFMAAVRKTED